MDLALVEEATRRSGVIWVTAPERSPRIAWHVWHEGAAWVVTGGLEQELPGVVDGATVEVAVRSKATQDDLVVTWSATVTAVPPGSEAWAAVVPLLHEARQSPPDGEQQPERWARESTVLRLAPG